MALNILVLFQPKFRIFCTLVFTCIIFILILVYFNLLEINIDPNSDAIEISDGTCKSYSENSEIDISTLDCINPKQFSIHSIRRNHKSTIVTLFTSLKLDETSAENTASFKRVLNNWGSLRPWVRPVLFEIFPNSTLSKQKLSNMAKLGWNIEMPPRLIKNSKHYVLRDMFTTLSDQLHYHTPFVGYAKPGILFDYSIVETLMYVSRIPRDKLDGRGLLLIGRNSEAKATEVPQFYGNVTFVSKLYQESSLSEPSDINYLISTRNEFPWQQVPDFVVGQTGFEKWAAWTAAKLNITVIDVTLSLHSVKQLSERSTYLKRKSISSVCVRNEISQKLKRMVQAQTACAPYFTKNVNGVLKIFKRRNQLRECKTQTNGAGNHLVDKNTFC